MGDILSLFFESIFIENMIFAYFLGICAFFAVSKNMETSIGLGIAICFVLVITLPINYLLHKYVLKSGALIWLGEEFAAVDLSFLSLLIFIAVIASITQIVEMIIEKYAPALYTSLGIFLPLLACNCAIFAGSLFIQERNFPNIGHAFVYALGSGIGWLVAIVGLAAVRQKLTYSNIPAPLRGFGITFITVGLMAIGFMCFLGL
ncbi:MAG: NADH:ubiquinone reductase (Na(+)-transporting) subunit E [Prevotellaceae bacterium]|jgi:Na+-transporting NADH:ubiquinone oxidoreductase subunit E|nr:NADH:ubiquinone reductase (Na(+)-transporting) subunit E [Prevotellaceae bacterium]